MPPAPTDQPLKPSEDVAAWDEPGPPRSRRHGDIYFSAQDGLGEARSVFLVGCGLPEAWAGRARFTVGELGLGAGLNIAALLHLWTQTRPAAGHLRIFSVENDLLNASEAARALAPWPEIDGVAQLLVSRWPPRARGFHRVDLPELSATLDVAVMDGHEGLAAWQGRADAWFLDGFSPALDPSLWDPEILKRVAARSASGARAATYTVAGAVRRGLAAAGFAVARRPGHGRKRERLEASWPGGPACEAPAPRVAIIGAGIAGAALARAFRVLGVEAVIFEEEHPGAGASGGPAALVAPRLDAGLGDIAALFAQAARRAVALYEEIPGAITGRGAMQIATGPKDDSRFRVIAGSDLFAPGHMAILDAEGARARVGEDCGPGLDIADAVILDPKAVLAAWLGGVRIAGIAQLERTEGRWRLIDAAGGVLGAFDVVCLAAGARCGALCPGLPSLPVRGQANWAPNLTSPELVSMGAVSFGGYVLPTPGGVLFGATHDRGDRGVEIRETDTTRNLAGVEAALPHIAKQLSTAQTQGWAATRATTADYLPLAGGWAEGLAVLSGLGSRGFTLAPVLAEHIAAEILGASSPLPRPLAALVAPGRFAARFARRRDRSGLNA
jgi:tRNA 5-methylaminomethyl-2-thiouridine biosynthesis bifunctional protein